MDWLTGLLGALTALIAAASGGLAVWRDLRRRDAITDRRVDLLWEAQLRRGELEMRAKAGRLIEPEGTRVVTLQTEVRAAYRPIAPALRQLRRAMAGATPEQFAEAVESRYGPWIARHICAVLGVSNFACLVMAQSVAEEDSPTDDVKCQSPEGK